LQFVKVDEVDPIFFDKSYYLAPDEAVSKPYALLLKAMTDTEYVAVAKLAMHSREHIVIIRPTEEGLVLHTMYFVDELHRAKAAPKNTSKQFSAKEMDLARKLIDTLASPFRAEEYQDEYKKNVEHLIERKRAGKSVTAVKQPAMKPVVDIMQALQASLAKGKAPGKKARPKRGKAA